MPLFNVATSGDWIAEMKEPACVELAVLNRAREWDPHAQKRNDVDREWDALPQEKTMCVTTLLAASIWLGAENMRIFPLSRSVSCSLPKGWPSPYGNRPLISYCCLQDSIALDQPIPRPPQAAGFNESNINLSSRK